MSLVRKRHFKNKSIYKEGIIDSKIRSTEKRFQLVMLTFIEQTELIPNEDKLPTAKIKANSELSVYNTAELTYDLPSEIRLLWSLAAELYKMDQTNDYTPVSNWLRNLVWPYLEEQLDRQKQMNNNDPYLPVYIYLSFGQLQLASNHASTCNNDTLLATHIMSLETNSNHQKIIQDQIETIYCSNGWHSMTSYQKKCWYIIGGSLGYIEKDEICTIEGIHWQCVLGMYIWFNCPLNQQTVMGSYNKMLDTLDKTNSHIVRPDRLCLWFQLLQWWVGNESFADLDSWPIELVWILSVYKKEKKVDPEYSNRWIDDLQNKDYADLALYASLFLENPKPKIDYILRQCEWSSENKLIHEYCIPQKQIQLAKALNAHDSWDFELEYQYLIDGELYHQAKLALFHFLLPKLFQNADNIIGLGLSFINKFPIEKQDEELSLLRQGYEHLCGQNSLNEETKNMYIKSLVDLQNNYKMLPIEATIQHLINLIDL